MDRAFSPAAPGTQAPESRDVIPQEFGTNGIGDFHAPGVIVRQENGHTVTDFKYRSHKIYKGKPTLEGLPATFGADGEVRYARTLAPRRCERCRIHPSLQHIHEIQRDRPGGESREPLRRNRPD